MQEKTNIQTSTLRVPKNILEKIKIYCRKAGKPVGEWVETAWKFIEKNKGKDSEWQLQERS